MKTRLLTRCLLVMTLVLPAGLLAQPDPPDGSIRPMMMMHQRMMDELKLTDQQRKDIDKIHSDAMKDQIDRFAALGKARVELQDLIKADNPSQATLEKKIGEISQLRSQVATKRLSTWFTINKMLTPDQQKVWKKALEQHASLGERMRMRGRMGMRGGQMNRMHQMGGPMGPGTPGPR